jgi:hypothetical protein
MGFTDAFGGGERLHELGDNAQLNHKHTLGGVRFAFD